MIKSQSGQNPTLGSIHAEIGLGTIMYKHTDEKIYPVGVIKVSRDKHSGEKLIEPDTPCFVIEHPEKPGKNLLEEFPDCNTFSEES